MSDYLFPPFAGQVEGAADEEGHEAGQGVAQPEAVAVQAHGEAEEGGKADTGDDAVDDRDGEVQARTAGAVDQGEASARLPAPARTYRA